MRRPPSSNIKTVCQRAAVVVVVAVALTAVSQVCSRAKAQQPEVTQDAEFLAGLRQRQLYSLAEAYCLDVLSDESLAISRRADIVVQLSQTLAHHAMQVRGDQGVELWDRATAGAEQFAVQNPGPWGTIVRAQSVMVMLDRGIWTRQRAEVAGNNERLTEEARGYLRDAFFKMEDVTKELQQALAGRGRNTDPTLPSRSQLLALQKNLEFHTARGFMAQGQCYPANTPDYELALMRANELLAELARLNPIDPLAWQARLKYVECQRLLRQFEVAKRDLNRLVIDADPPPAVELAARAELTRIHLADTDIPGARRVLEQGVETQGQRSEELDFAVLEFSLAQWRILYAGGDTQNAEAADTWKNASLEAVKVIKRHHAPYWAMRAETLLASSMTGADLRGDVAMLAGNAEALLREERIDDALIMFDQAAQAAEDAGQPEEAFQLAYKAALIEHERLHHAAAARRARDVALRFSSQREACDAHLVAVHNTAEVAKTQTPPDLTEYVTLLEEHVATWPSHSTTGQALWALAVAREHLQEFESAAANYLRIPPQDSNALPGLLSAARVYRQLLSSRRAEGDDVDESARRAAAEFEDIVFGAGEERRWPERWSPAQREAALAAVDLRLMFTDDRQAEHGPYERCLGILDRALRDNSIAPEEWRLRLKASYIWALVGLSTDDNNRLEEARQMAASMSTAPPSSVLTLLAGLAEVSEQFPPDKRREIGQMQLAAGRPLWEQVRTGDVPLSEGERRQLWKLVADAYAAAGEPVSALSLYAPLHEQFPRDGDIAEDYAKILLENAGTPEEMQKSLELWRYIERASEAGSPRWFRAKYALARTYERQGNKDTAAQIVRVTRAIYADLGGAELKQKFEELLARCEGG